MKIIIVIFVVLVHFNENLFKKSPAFTLPIAQTGEWTNLCISGGVFIMKKIRINKFSKVSNKKIYALVDDEDYDRLNNYNWSKTAAGYVFRTIKGTKRMLYMHRYIIGVKDSNKIIDHKDRNPLNNQKTNLRICTKSENALNTSKTIGKSGYRGVCKYILKYSIKSGKTINRKGWMAQITINGNRRCAWFKTKIDAAKQYNEWVIQFKKQKYVTLNRVDNSQIKYNKRKNNFSKHTGINFSRNRFISRITVNKKRIYLGCFEKEKDAVAALNRYKKNNLL